jgi:hypothetical protein
LTTAAFRRRLSVLVVTSAALAGCARDQPPATPGAADFSSTTAPADSGETASNTCLASDIACQERLYQLEETLFAYEAGVASQIGEQAQPCWRADSDAFRRTVDACDSVECKEVALLERIASIHFLQPNEDRATLDLPAAALLLAVLGPDTDVGMPGVQSESAGAFEVQGSLVHAGEHPEHMGVAVRSRGGDDHVFIFDMDIGNQPGHDEVLGLVGTSPTTQVLVRGYQHLAPSGIANVDTSRCRLVYQLP